MNKTIISNNIRRRVSLLLAALFLTLTWTQTALAAYSVVTSVNITLDIDLVAGDSLPSLSTGYSDDSACEVRVSSNSRYDLGSAKWSSDVDEVRLGSSYTLKIYVEPGHDYRFSGSYSSRNVHIKGGTFVSARRQSNGDLLVTAKSRPAEGEYEPPEDAYWLDTSSHSRMGQARWSRVDDAAYDVYLYRSGKIVEKKTRLTGTSYNFYPYMTQKGVYSFRVRAVAEDSEASKYADSSDWVSSGETYIDEEDVSDGSGRDHDGGSSEAPSGIYDVGWIKDSNRWYFRYPDGSYVKNNWARIGDKWYLFDSNGVMMTGWHKRNDRTYFLKASGEMATGWIKHENRWYYLEPLGNSGVEGAMVTGWRDIAGKSYYLNADGSMAEGWQEVDGNWYYFYPNDGWKATNTDIGMFHVNQDGIWIRQEENHDR